VGLPAGSEQPRFELAPGRYLLTVNYDHATKRQEVEVSTGKLTSVQLVLDAGRLAPTALLVAGGTPLYGTWWIESATVNDLGKREMVVNLSRGDHPEFVVAAGRYLVTVQYDQAWKRQEVEVSAGKLSETRLILKAGVARK